jgi:transcriptional regulator with XRE-family HTH domain
VDRAPRKTSLCITLLKALRLSSGMSLGKASSLIGVSESYYCHVESGYRRVPRKWKPRIEDKFSMRCNYLFDREGYAIQITPTDVIMLAGYKIKRKSNR